MSALKKIRSTPGDLPEDVVISGVVEQIECLFFAVVKLYRPRRFSSQQTWMLDKRTKLTRGAPGSTKLAMNDPRAAL